MTRRNSAAARSARATARDTGISYTAALYARRTREISTRTLEVAGWGPQLEVLAPVTEVRADTNYRLAWPGLSRDRNSHIGSATGRQLLAQTRLSDPRHGDGPMVDIRPLVDFNIHREEKYGAIVVSVGVVYFTMSVDSVYYPFCNGCPFHSLEVGLDRALDAAREHNDEHVEFPGDWGFQRTTDGRWRRTRP